LRCDIGRPLRNLVRWMNGKNLFYVSSEAENGVARLMRLKE
jgi:hypothetical protein